MNALHLALLLLTPGLPLLLALASGWLARPTRWLAWAPLPGLLCALLVPAGSSLALPQALLGTALQLDATGAVFLGFSALLWLAAGLHAHAYLGAKPRARSFSAFWLLTQAGSLGVFLAADVVGFYLAFACVSLPAYVLVIHERSAASLRAGRVYIAMAVAGETALLLGLLLGVHAAQDIGLAPVRAALAQAPNATPALVLIFGGVGLKAGLLPLHGWLPLAHSAAPVPASAVLSGAIVKAGVIGLLRFLPGDGALPQTASVLLWLGLATAWAGVLLGLPQRLPKAVLAYSTMSQMGLLVAVLAAGAARPGLQAATEGAVALFAAHHGLVKGALFLAAGLLAAGAGARRPLLVLVALLGAVLAGLPLSGGALAKLAGKEALGPGAAAHTAAWAATGTLLLMLRLLWLLWRAPAAATPPEPEAAVRQQRALALLAACALLLPWLLQPRLAAHAAEAALAPASWWAGLWPLLLGLAIAGGAWKLRLRAPALPVGEIAAWADDRVMAWRTAAAAPGAGEAPVRALRMPAGLGAAVQAAAARLALFSTSALALLVLVLVLLLALVLGRALA